MTFPGFSEDSREFLARAGRGGAKPHPNLKRVTDGIMGPTPSFRLSALSPRISPAPVLGQDTESALSGMLGYDGQRIEALKQKEILV